MNNTLPTIEGDVEWLLDWQMRAVLEASLIAMNSDDPTSIKVTQELIDYHKNEAKGKILDLIYGERAGERKRVQAKSDPLQSK
jgi:hypothetical protein